MKFTGQLTQYLTLLKCVLYLRQKRNRCPDYAEGELLRPGVYTPCHCSSHLLTFVDVFTNRSRFFFWHSDVHARNDLGFLTILRDPKSWSCLCDTGPWFDVQVDALTSSLHCLHFIFLTILTHLSAVAQLIIVVIALAGKAVMMRYTRAFLKQVKEYFRALYE